MALHDGTTWQKRWRIAVGDHAAAYLARREFANALRELLWSEAEYASAELVFGELVHNAVRHAHAEVIVELSAGVRPQLRVSDDGPGFSMPAPQPANPEAESGRGLLMVRAMAPDVHVERTPEGRSVVTASLPLRRPTMHRQ